MTCISKLFRIVDIFVNLKRKYSISHKIYSIFIFVLSSILPMYLDV